MARRSHRSSRYAPGSEAARLRKAARAFFPGKRAVAVLGGSPGYSGSAGPRVAARPKGELDHLSRRLDTLADEIEQRVGPLVRAVRDGDANADSEIASRWLDLLPSALAAVREASEELPEDDRGAEAVCHGDLWPAHVRFDGEAFVGFTDFESLAFASPALDLAQLVTHFAGWESCEAILRSYETIFPLKERDLAVLPIEAVADLAGEGLWSLLSLYGESLLQRSPAQESAHRRNLRTLLVSLAQATEEAKWGQT